MKVSRDAMSDALDEIIAVRQERVRYLQGCLEDQLDELTRTYASLKEARMLLEGAIEQRKDIDR